MITPGKDITPDIPGIELALRRAYSLGQKYWQDADSEYTSHHRRADETQIKFEHLVADTKAALEAFAAGPTGIAK